VTALCKLLDQMGNLKESFEIEQGWLFAYNLI
jgi:hypothetical protein